MGFVPSLELQSEVYLPWASFHQWSCSERSTYFVLRSINGVVVKGLAHLEGVGLGGDGVTGERHCGRERVTGLGELQRVGQLLVRLDPFVRETCTKVCSSNDTQQF